MICRMKWKIAAAVFFAASLVMIMYPVNQPEWTTKVMDTEHPERFVSVSTAPSIAYFNEKGMGGVLFFASPSSGPLQDDINYYYNGRQWAGGTIDGSPYAGMFISSAADSSGVHVSYQDATLGNEKLMYAFYNGSWAKEVVDDVRSEEHTS